jgi:hypothetical protein
MPEMKPTSKTPQGSTSGNGQQERLREMLRRNQDPRVRMLAEACRRSGMPLVPAERKTQ